MSQEVEQREASSSIRRVLPLVMHAIYPGDRVSFGCEQGLSVDTTSRNYIPRLNSGDGSREGIQSHGPAPKRSVIPEGNTGL